MKDISFVVGTLDYKIESDALTNNSITVPASGEYKFDITLTSLNSIDSKYELYYLIDGAKVTNNDIQIGYTSDSKDSVKGTITANSKKEITVRIKNNTSKSVNIYIGCEGGLINNELILTLGNNLDRLIASDDIMLAYTYIGENNGPTKFPDSDDGYYVKELTCTGGTAEWDNNTWTMKITSTSAQNITCNATLVDYYKDNSGANVPVVATGMIPVTYDGTDWVKADLSKEWYNYDEQWWANAVTVSETNRDTYMNAKVGTPISMDDINTMWVWVPRYEYETITSTTVAEIKVNFLNGTESNKTNNYITHPGFEFGDKSLTGIWVAKFEASSDKTCTSINAAGDINEGCDVTTLKINVKPNVPAWIGIRVSTLDLNARVMDTLGNIYGFSENEVDTHVMKNIEWGAIAYLSQSKYGKYGNPNYEGANKEIYQNKSQNHITGMSNGTPSTLTFNTQVSYNVQGTGTGASTSGNIYGIYDMSGGAWEYTMGVMKDNNKGNPMSGTSTEENSGFEGIVYNSGIYKNILGRVIPNVRYYDFYDFGTTSNDEAAYVRSKTGDATAETKGWYVDYADFLYSNYPWSIRGGCYNDVEGAGLFTFSRFIGYSHVDCSFRPVLINQ